MPEPFRPVVYLKNGCPFCFKLRLALLELNALGDVDIRTFSSGSAEEEAIKNELAGKTEKLTFPIVETASGKYKGESDELVAHFASSKSIAVEDLPTLAAYVEGPFKKLMMLSKENKALKGANHANK